MKILETRNATRIRKEVLLLRKFLELGGSSDGVPSGMDDDLAIYDEVRYEESSKDQSRYLRAPRRR